MEYITAAEAAEKWGVTPRQVQRLLAANRIPHVKKYHRSWMIPTDAEKPDDQRREDMAANRSLSSALNHAIASTYIPAPHDNPEAIFDIIFEKKLWPIPEIGFAYASGDFERVKRCFFQIGDDDAVKLGACPVTIAAAISMGDYPFYLEVEAYLNDVVKTTPCADVSAFAQLALSGAYLGAGAPNMVPDWLKDGDFSALPPSAKPTAACSRVQYFRWQGNFELMLAVAQTTLALCAAQHGISYEDTYLRILCAAAHYTLGRADEARQYLLDTMRINLPHGFITPFAELMPLFGGLLEQCLEKEFPQYYDGVIGQWKRTFTNWLTFHNRFTRDHITLILPLRDYEMARLVAHRVPYAKIAKQYNLSVGRLNNIMRKIYSELFVNNREELAKMIL